MKYLDYREDNQQGTFDFPIAFYHVESNHPRYQMPYHWHPEYEIIRILKGTFQLTIDGQSLLVTENDVLFIQGGNLHGGIPEECIYECVVFDMKLLLSNNKISSKQIQQLMRHEISISLVLPRDLDSLKMVINELFTVMSEKKPGYEFLIQGLLYYMLGKLFETQSYHINTTQPTASSLQIMRFKDVLNYIEAHYTESISLEDMARIAGLSSRYFCRFFRKMTQCTPMEYLNYYRIESACEQLADIQVSITDVALNCGFNDISYFIKSFHKAKGITPKQYKESNRQLSGF
jgi:AraC-like DNA-binding protein